MAKRCVSDEARKEFSYPRRAFNDVNSQFQTKLSQAYRSPKTVTQEYKAKFDQLEESANLETLIAEVQERKKKLRTMTADEFFAKHLVLKQKFDDEIRNDNWGY